jgi:replicative DNA helicase
MAKNNKLTEEPFADDAERAVLGAMLLDREAISKTVEIIRKPEYFYLNAHSQIYSAIIKLYDANIPVDVLTLSNELKKTGELEVVGGSAYFTELLESVISSANVTQYAKIVADAYTLRQLLKLNNQAVETIQSGWKEPDELLEQQQQAIFNLQLDRVHQDFVPLKSLLTPHFELMESLSKTRGKAMRGVPSGFKDLDKLIIGFQPTDLIIIGGRPSMGKSSLCLNIATNVAIMDKIPVGIFSVEMAKEALTMRIVCSEARVNSHWVRQGVIRRGDWTHLTRAAGVLSEAPIFIDDTSNIYLSALCAKARRLKAHRDIQLLIVDHMQLITGPKAENRQQEVTQISKTLKALARELYIPVVVASQLSRAPDKRPDKIPTLSDLRESGAIEQDADLVIFIHRNEFYGKEAEKGLATISVGKNRNGPIGNFDMAYIKEYTRFQGLATTDRPVDTTDWHEGEES